MKKYKFLLLCFIILTLVGCNEPSNNYEFTYINKKDIFSLEDEKYYVTFVNSESLKSNDFETILIEFNNLLISYPENIVPKFYLIDIDKSENSIGENKDLIGINNFNDLINNAKIENNTLIIVENSTIIEYYTGINNISSYINLEIKNISNENILHDIDNSKETKISVDFIPTQYSITDSNNNKEEYKLPHTIYPTGKASITTEYSDGYVIFNAYRFNTLKPGNYKLDIYNEEVCKTVNLYVISQFNYIDVENIFEVTDDKYYVFFLKDGCPYCNSVKPTLLEYSKNYLEYTMQENYPIYAVHRSHNYNFKTNGLRVNIVGSADNLIGVDTYTDIKFTGYPRVVLIENGVITKAYKTSQIIEFFQK